MVKHGSGTILSEHYSFITPVDAVSSPPKEVTYPSFGGDAGFCPQVQFVYSKHCAITIVISDKDIIAESTLCIQV
jgi:hypothetical protein